MAFKDFPPSYYEATATSSAQPPYQSQYPSSSQRVVCREGSTPVSYEDAGDDNLDEFLDFTHKPPPPKTSHARLAHPVAIPQLVPGAGKPFARAFAPALSAHDIAESDFLAFLDNLNIVASGTPPLRILGLTSGLIGMVPWHYAQLLSLGVQVAAKAGNRVYASVRGDRFVEEVNRSFFAPRGLKMSLITGEALAQMLEIDYYGTAHMVAAATDGHLISPQTLTNAMSRKIEELNFDVPPPMKQDNVLDQLSARVQAGEAKKFQEKLQKRISKQRRGSGSSSSSDSRFSSADSPSRSTDEFAQKMEKLEQWKANKMESLQQKDLKDSKRAREEAKIWGEYEEKLEKIQEKQRKAERESRRKEEKSGRHDRSRSKSKHGKGRSKDEEKMVEALGKLQWILIQSM